MLQYYDYVHHENFKFDSKEDFLSYIESRMTDYWKAHNNSFSNVCEALDSMRSTDEKKYDVNYSEVFKELVNNYDQIFDHRYDNAYYILFNDVDIINSQDENKIQDDMNKGYYNYLFVDDNEFFWYGLLDDMAY